jgi:hypothetical protein
VQGFWGGHGFAPSLTVNISKLQSLKRHEFTIFAKEKITIHQQNQYIGEKRSFWVGINFFYFIILILFQV